MTSDALRFYASYFANLWKFYVSWNIPGTTFTPAELSFFVLAVSILIRTLKRLSNVPDASFGGSSKSSSSKE